MIQDFLGDPLPLLPTHLETPRKVILGTGKTVCTGTRAGRCTPQRD